MTRVQGQFERDPKKVMRHFIDNPPWQHILFEPQHRFVTDEDGTMLADRIGRVEAMQESYDQIAARIGIPSTTLEKVNSSNRRDFRGYYDDSLVEGVAKLYARDMELFGYEF
jgi:ligand-binding SRPBCC domain-containing protein